MGTLVLSLFPRLIMGSVCCLIWAWEQGAQALDRCRSALARQVAAPRDSIYISFLRLLGLHTTYRILELLDVCSISITVVASLLILALERPMPFAVADHIFSQNLARFRDPFFSREVSNLL